MPPDLENYNQAWAHVIERAWNRHEVLRWCVLDPDFHGETVVLGDDFDLVRAGVTVDEDTFQTMWFDQEGEQPRYYAEVLVRRLWDSMTMHNVAPDQVVSYRAVLLHDHQSLGYFLRLLARVTPRRPVLDRGGSRRRFYKPYTDRWINEDTRL